MKNPTRRKGANTHTHTFLIVFIKKLIRNPRRREAPWESAEGGSTHTDTFLIISSIN